MNIDTLKASNPTWTVTGELASLVCRKDNIQIVIAGAFAEVTTDGFQLPVVPIHRNAPGFDLDEVASFAYYKAQNALKAIPDKCKVK